VLFSDALHHLHHLHIKCIALMSIIDSDIVTLVRVLIDRCFGRVQVLQFVDTRCVERFDDVFNGNQPQLVPDLFFGPFQQGSLD
jgi:hypothetical protein